MTIPAVIIAVLAMLWFGLGDFTVIFVVALIVMPTMYVNTVAGVLAIDRRLVEMGRVYRFPRGLLLTRDLPAGHRLSGRSPGSPWPPASPCGPWCWRRSSRP